MLNTSPEFDQVSRGSLESLGGDATKAVTETLLFREFNSILNPTVSGPDAIDPRFGLENMLNTRAPLFRGISYGPMDEYYLSDDPATAYRFIESSDFDEERDVAYYIPEDVSEFTSELAEVTIDYGDSIDINGIGIRYDNSYNQFGVYDYQIEVYAGNTPAPTTLLYDSVSDNTGVTEIFYNGTDWQEGASRVEGSKQSYRYVKLIVRKGVSGENVNPRIMYFGAMSVDRLDDDIIDLSIQKSEFEESTYLPYGESSTNSMTLSLDNTAGNYRYGPNVDEEYFDKHQRIRVRMGFDVGDSTFEYVNAGTYYIEDFTYSESDMTISVNAGDYSMFLKERMCNNFIWLNKSLKYIIKDALAQAGFSPRFCTFNFGIAANAAETNLKKVVWSSEDQSVWDFLSTLIGSEMGNMYFDEIGELIFTDREYFRTSIDDGVKLTLDADTDITGLQEKTVIGANKISVKYSDIGASKTAVNPAPVVGSDGSLTYVNLGEKFKNDILWSPSDDTFLGSGVLAKTLNPGSKHLFLPIEDANQISEDEGYVRIGREFIKYKDRTITGPYLRLTIVERGAFNSPVTPEAPVSAAVAKIRTEGIRNKALKDTTTYATLMKSTRRGLRLRKLHKHSAGRGKWIKYFINPLEMNYSTNYDVYGCSFTFNELPSSGYTENQAAGIFINNNHLDRAIYFEVNKDGIVDGIPNMAAYKGGIDMNSSVYMPPFPESHTEANRILFAETTVDDKTNQTKLGTPIEIMVFNDKVNNRISWFVNGNTVASFDYTYGYHPLFPNGKWEGLTKNQETILEYNMNKGEFGIFLRGSTDITVDYMFATNKDQFDGYDVLNTYNPENNSWKRRYLPESFTGYYEEFGSIVHEVAEFKADHSVFPNLNPRLLNTLDHKLEVHYQSHTPFSSKILVSNNDRYGVNINGTNFSPDGTSVTSGFLVYGVPIVTEEDDEIEVIDKEAIRKYGPQEVEVANDWIDSKGLANSIAKSMRAQWKKPVSFFSIDWFPNPALQVGDRIVVDYPEKGFTNFDIWIVTGVSISYDGGLSGTLTLKRYTESPPVP